MADNITVLKNKGDFDSLVASAANKAIIVDFHATWCGPCKMIAPYFQELVASHPNTVAAKCDVDEADDLAQEMGIEAMPTFMVFKGGQKVDSLRGANKEKLKELFDKYN